LIQIISLDYLAKCILLEHVIYWCLFLLNDVNPEIHHRSEPYYPANLTILNIPRGIRKQ
jgi:hypothetical protein